MKKYIKILLYSLPIFGTYLKFISTRPHNRSFWSYLWFLIKLDKTIYWPRDKNNFVANAPNITVGYNSSIGGSGCYLQGNGRLIIGNYVRIATNVGVMSSNHDINYHWKQIPKTTIINDYSWIGMNSVILPGVHLGPRTVVGAGSVVTKSFPEGFCIVAGNPAVKIKDIDRELFKPHLNKYDFYGYVPAEKFEKFKKKHLSSK